MKGSSERMRLIVSLSLITLWGVSRGPLRVNLAVTALATLLSKLSYYFSLALSGRSNHHLPPKTAYNQAGFLKMSRLPEPTVSQYLCKVLDCETQYLKLIPNLRNFVTIFYQCDEGSWVQKVNVFAYHPLLTVMVREPRAMLTSLLINIPDLWLITGCHTEAIGDSN